MDGGAQGLLGGGCSGASGGTRRCLVALLLWGVEAFARCGVALWRLGVFGFVADLVFDGAEDVGDGAVRLGGSFWQGVEVFGEEDAEAEGAVGLGEGGGEVVGGGEGGGLCGCMGTLT